jgi:undecaprenyl-phosphate 4-deoxy-4-formamido-L-arabinose transferase
MLVRKIVYDDLVSGFATIAVMSSFSLAILLFSLGVIGEYIYRINLKTTQRPNFKESEII